MSIFFADKTTRAFFVPFFLLALVIIGGIYRLPAAASNNAGDGQLSNDKLVSIKLKSQNSPTINLRPGLDLPTIYGSNDDSSDKLIAGQNRPTALASADFDVDGFPDLVTGYAAPDGSGIITFQKGNSEAFAPQSEESFALIKEGRFPDPFLKNAESFRLPAAPDFLVAGDFDRDGNMDIVTATRGGDKIYLLSGTGRDGGFNVPREINLAGRVTALTAGEIDISDNRADLAVGIEGDAGASLLVFEDSENGVFASPAIYGLSSPAISLEMGKLDDDLFADAAILTGDGVSILHGRNQRANVKSLQTAARLEKLDLPFVPQAIALGEFIYDRAGKTEMALLAADGTIQIAKRGELDERPFTIEESRANRRAALERSRDKLNDNINLKQTGAFENWTIADSMNVAAPSGERNITTPVLMKANLSGENTDDILFLDSDTKQIKILSTQEPEKQNGEAVSFAGQRSVYNLEAENQPMAMLSMPLNIFARSGLVILQAGKTEPSILSPAATLTLNVDRFDDTNAAQGCADATPNDCSLRGALTKANNNSGADIINLPAGTYTLSLANSGGNAGNSNTNNEDNNATGDLDILDSITIMGAGQASTIVQAGTTNANGIDKVFASNPICTSTVNTTMTGLTVRFGRNTQPYNAADFSFTGGGMDWCNTGSNGTLTVTNSTFDQNTVVNGYGGGIDLSNDPALTSGSVSLTGVTLSNNTLGVNLANYGAGLASVSGPYNVTMTNSTVSGNSTPGEGGGIYVAHLGQDGTADAFQFHGITVSGNSSGKIGGGMDIDLTGNQNFTLDQSSTVSGNTSGTNSGSGNTARGGGIEISGLGSSTSTITKTTVTGNILSPNAPSQQGGAGIYADNVSPASITISYSRIFGNTGTTAAIGTGLRKGNSSGTVTAINNWWGCNTGPSAAPCNTAVLQSGSTGSLNYTPWLRYTLTASPSTIVVGQGSTLTASFLTNSAGQVIAASNLDVLFGLPITFNSIMKGTVSPNPATIQNTGMATATFTATSPGAGSANAIVDNGTATASITINLAAPTTTVTPNANPSVFGQTVTFTATVSGGVSPTGTVQFKDGAATIAGCGAVALSGGTAQCMTNTLTVGSHTITAVYSGDTNNTGSTSPNLTQTVNQANTTTTITADNPDPSNVGQAVTVTYTVTVNSPGAGTPTGNVTVSDGVNSCTGTVAAGSCAITLNTPGARTLTATYNSDANFNASPASAGAAHMVNTPPDLTITKTHTGNFTQGQTGAQYTITVTNSGGSTTSGTVTVVDTLPAGLTATAISGTGWTCDLPTRTCTRSDALSAGSSYEVITLTVTVGLNASSLVTNSATVSGGGETNTSNDTASDPTTVLVLTAATVAISGRVTTITGRGISGAVITLTDSEGTGRTAITTSFGYYRFDNIQAGETYVLSASGKHYSFSQPVQVLNIQEQTDQVNFIANPEKKIRGF